MPKTPNPLSALADEPQGLSLGLELPPGTLLGTARKPLLWVSDGPVGAGALASYRSRPDLAAAGLQAVLFQERRGLEEWWLTKGLRPERMSDPDDHHVEPVLREFWNSRLCGRGDHRERPLGVLVGLRGSQGPVTRAERVRHPPG